MVQKHAVRTHRLKAGLLLSVWLRSLSSGSPSALKGSAVNNTVLHGEQAFKVDIVATSFTYVRCVHVCLCICLDPRGAIVR